MVCGILSDLPVDSRRSGVRLSHSCFRVAGGTDTQFCEDATFEHLTEMSLGLIYLRNQNRYEFHLAGLSGLCTIL